MNRQKFHHGDLVQIAADLGLSMEHFTKDCRAIVIGSYRDQYGGASDREPEYTLFVEGEGKTSWYYEHQLTLLSRDRNALLEEWKEQTEARSAQLADLAWIGAHWDEVKKAPTATSILALFHAVEMSSVFECNGEYFSLYGDWYKAFPYLDFVLTSPDLEAIKAAQGPNCDPKIAQLTEQLWKATHGQLDKIPLGE